MRSDRRLAVLLLIGMFGLALACPFSQLSNSLHSPAHVKTVGGIVNEWIGTGSAAEIASWSLSHVPIDGENLLFDDAGGQCDFDVYIHANNITLTENYLSEVFILVGGHVTGNITMEDQPFSEFIYGATRGITVSSLTNNLMVDGWVNIGDYGSFRFNDAGGTNTTYFNGAFTAAFTDTGEFSCADGSIVFNSTVDVTGSEQPYDYGDLTYSTAFNFGSETDYIVFNDDVTIDQVHIVSIGGGEARADFSLTNIEYFLLGSNLGNPFTFYEKPYFGNISKCATCGYPVEINIGYSGTLGLNDELGSDKILSTQFDGFEWIFTGLNSTIFDGYVSDYIKSLGVATTGNLYQTTNLTIGDVENFYYEDAPVMNIYQGHYFVNGTNYLFIAPNVGSINEHEGTLNVYDNFSLDRGNLTADYLNVHVNGSVYGENGTFQVNNFNTSAGHFYAGNSTVVFKHTIDYTFQWPSWWAKNLGLTWEADNPPGTLRTNGNISGAINNLTIEAGAEITLLSDVYVLGTFTNNGTVNFNGFTIYTATGNYAGNYTGPAAFSSYMISAGLIIAGMSFLLAGVFRNPVLIIVGLAILVGGGWVGLIVML